MEDYKNVKNQRIVPALFGLGSIILITGLFFIPYWILIFIIFCFWLQGFSIVYDGIIIRSTSLKLDLLKTISGLGLIVYVLGSGGIPSLNSKIIYYAVGIIILNGIRLLDFIYNKDNVKFYCFFLISQILIAFTLAILIIIYSKEIILSLQLIIVCFVLGGLIDILHTIFWKKKSSIITIGKIKKKEKEQRRKCQEKYKKDYEERKKKKDFILAEKLYICLDIFFLFLFFLVFFGTLSIKENFRFLVQIVLFSLFYSIYILLLVFEGCKILDAKYDKILENKSSLLLFLSFMIPFILGGFFYLAIFIGPIITILIMISYGIGQIIIALNDEISIRKFRKWRIIEGVIFIILTNLFIGMIFISKDTAIYIMAMSIVFIIFSHIGYNLLWKRDPKINQSDNKKDNI